ncbi:MAG: pyridoxal-phosphate dependent enzyme [Planctomycetes bacterium]|nr:pyridoxal-phosphate dependent enzyme [Planctomycetota bacterium]
MLNAHPDRLCELKTALARRPRVSLIYLPTPLEFCPGLTRELRGPDIWIKRDDLTGLATGGNKSRMFEYVLGEAKAAGAETVVGGAAVQSNYCRQLAASCAKTGLECHLLLRRVRGKKDDEIQGGLLLDLLCGAKVQIVDVPDWVAQGESIRQYARKLQQQGRRVYVARVGDESRLGLYACAYAHAFAEIIEQAEAAKLKIDEMWVCSSDTTQGGLAIALKHIQSSIRLVGVPALAKPITPGYTFPECISAIGNECAEILALPTRLQPGDITSVLDYVGPGYGILTDAAREAMRMAGRSDAIILDPVYTSKTLAGLIDHIRRGRLRTGQKVLFLHTGGLPALFAYADTLGLQDLLIQ